MRYIWNTQQYPGKCEGKKLLSKALYRNSLIHFVQVQVEQGVDAVIVDSVLAIRKGLTAAAAESNSNGKHDRPEMVEIR